MFFLTPKIGNLWIHLSSKEFSWVSMSKIPSQHLQMEKWEKVFEKFIFELEASCSFKNICILVKQVISLKKNGGGVINKIYCLISWCPICAPLIFVSASMKMASISAAVIYNSMEWTPLGTPHTRVKELDRRLFTLALDSILVYTTWIM